MPQTTRHEISMTCMVEVMDSSIQISEGSAEILMGDHDS